MKRCLTVAALVLLSCSGAYATPLSLGQGLSLSLNPSQSGNLTLSVTNSNTVNAPASVNNYSLGLQLIPSGTTTGLVTISNFSDVGLANSLLSDSQGSGLLSTSSLFGGASVNGSTSYYSIVAGNQSATNDSLSVGSSANLGVLTISAGTGTAGTWNLYAVNQAASASQNFSSYGDSSFATFNDFSSLTTSSSASPASLLIGTVTVSAVPEPGSLLLAGMASLGLGGYGWRRRKNVEAVEPSQPTDLAV